ncbi:hypothetical protein ABIA68_003742 [Stenotrophomonas rhizophila]|uniref:hypothetical protein n=1 Tax=Stenotrophomonas rhizophila TaxID=216778 RepID=UPI0033935091
MTVLLSALPKSDSSTSTLYDTVRDIESRPETDGDRLWIMRHAYDEGIPPALRSLECDSIPIDRREDLFLATHLVVVHRPDALLVDRLICLHDAIVATNNARPYHHHRVHGVLVASRRFSAANELRRKFGISVSEVPALELAGGTGPRRLLLSEDGVTDVPWPNQEGWQIVAVVHPHCAPSQRAMSKVMDGGTWSWMLPMLTLLVPAGSAWEEGEMRKWNAHHPTHPMAAEVPGRTPKGVATNETPVFHLLQNGRVIDTLRGMPEDGEALKAWRSRVVEEPMERRRSP